MGFFLLLLILLFTILQAPCDCNCDLLFYLLIYTSIYIFVSQYIYLQKQKDFISNTKKHTVNTNTHQSQSLQSSITLFNNRLVICQHFSTLIWILTLCLTCLCHLNFLFKLQLLIKVLPLTRLAFENIVVGTAPL